MATKKKQSPKIKDYKSSAEADNKMMMYALVVLFLAFVLFWVVKKNAMNNYVPQVNQKVEVNSYPAVNGSGDLDKAVKDLDTSDLNTIDKELNGLDTDSSNF